MGMYENYCLPYFLNLVCGLGVIQEQRKKIIPFAEGKVLEVGMGSGLNIPFYNTKNIEFVWGLEPSEGMRKKAKIVIENTPLDIRWLKVPSEEIPLDNNCVDTVVLTYTLCSISNWRKALQQMRRVLKPNGKLIFCEHGQAPDVCVQKWQNRINPLWGKLAGGCNLNRPIPQYLQEGGFNIKEIETKYLPGPKFAGFTYWGIATK